jgi:excisionase family DNA binding protein
MSRARKADPDSPLLLTTMEAAARLRVGRSKMQELIRDKHVDAFKIGRVVRVTIRSIDAYIARQLRQAG